MAGTDKEALEPMLGGYEAAVAPNKSKRWPFLCVAAAVCCASLVSWQQPSIFSAFKEWHLSPERTNSVEFTAEEQKIRNWKWTAPAVDPTIARIIGNLSDDERTVYEWLQRSRLTSEKATPIGLTAQSYPVKFNKPQSRPAPSTVQHAIKRLTKLGDAEKARELIAEAESGQRLRPWREGSWEEPYAIAHAQALGTPEARYLRFRCVEDEGPCGGLADRLTGLATTFIHSILTSRVFALVMAEPVPLDLIFDSPYIDWSTPYFKQSLHPVYGGLNTTSDVTHFGVVNQNDAWLLRDFWESKIPSLNDKYIDVSTNRGLVLGAFQGQNREALYERGLRMETAFSRLVKYLFQPKDEISAYINAYAALFALPSIFSIGIQIRTGDAGLLNMDSRIGIDGYLRFIDCAHEIASSRAAPHQKVVLFLLSDSHYLKEVAVERYSDIVVSGVVSKHIEDGLQEDDFDANARGFGGAVADIWMLSGTDYSVTHHGSGFGKMGVLLRGKEGRSVSVDAPIYNATTCYFDDAFAPLLAWTIDGRVFTRSSSPKLIIEQRRSLDPWQSLDISCCRSQRRFLHFHLYTTYSPCIALLESLYEIKAKWYDFTIIMG